jgi:hypothetical protein
MNTAVFLRSGNFLGIEHAMGFPATPSLIFSLALGHLLLLKLHELLHGLLSVLLVIDYLGLEVLLICV